MAIIGIQHITTIDRIVIVRSLIQKFAITSALEPRNMVLSCSICGSSVASRENTPRILTVDTEVSRVIRISGNARCGKLQDTLIARSTMGYAKYLADIPVDSTTMIVLNVPSMKNMLDDGNLCDWAMMKINIRIVITVSIRPPSIALRTTL